MVSFQEGVKSLLRQLKEETSTIEQKATRLIRETKIGTAKSDSTGEEMVFVPKSTFYLKKGIEEILGTKISIDILTDYSRYKSLHAHSDNPFDAAFRKALEKGVRIRLLIVNPRGGALQPREVQKFDRNPNFLIRITSKDAAASLAIHDKKKLLLFISKTTDVLKASILVTDNIRLAQIVQEYFDRLWNDAEEVTP